MKMINTLERMNQDLTYLLLNESNIQTLRDKASKLHKDEARRDLSDAETDLEIYVEDAADALEEAAWHLREAVKVLDRAARAYEEDQRQTLKWWKNFGRSGRKAAA